MEKHLAAMKEYHAVYEHWDYGDDGILHVSSEG